MIPTPFQWCWFWLAILFAGFGLLSARNATVVATLVICALSLGAIFSIVQDEQTMLEG
jgi:hypothetical protein